MKNAFPYKLFSGPKAFALSLYIQLHFVSQILFATVFIHTLIETRKEQLN